jgi:hypothetical protein
MDPSLYEDDVSRQPEQGKQPRLLCRAVTSVRAIPNHPHTTTQEPHRLGYRGDAAHLAG